MNEFYMVQFDWGEHYYFHNKDNAFNYLWQAYLNRIPYKSAEEMENDYQSLHEDYFIDGFGYIFVCGFED